jgi:predicted HTH transcriptional regulator
MDNWHKIALATLERSLNPVPIELNELDWKSNISEKSERLAQHLSAFTNNPGGGFLVFGINNNSQFIQLSKTDFETIIHKIGNIARNNLAQPISIEHAILDYKGNAILFIQIPESAEKPVFLRSGDIYDSYKRSAGSTVKLTRQEIKQLISQSNGTSFEQQVCLREASPDDLLKQLNYDSYFRLLEKRLPETKTGILQALANDELIVQNGNKWDITNLGAILFANDINNFKELKRKAIRLIVYKGTSRVDAIKEHIEIKGLASGFESLITYIMDQLPANEVIEKALRQQVKVFPEKAIREFVANALIHQDFYTTGTSVMIEIFTDRIEITNPGIPLVDTNRFIDTAPKSRNEILASLMRRMNICEERGSGIDRAIEAVELYQLPAPKFIKGDDYTRVILYSPQPFTKMSIDDRIRACYQHTCLHYVNNQEVTNQTIRKRFNISKNNYPMASKIIAESIDAGLIKASDPANKSKKFSIYVPFWV